MKILVTGSNGFLAKNLIAELKNRGYGDIFEFDINTPEGLLKQFSATCDFVFHFAGVTRPKDEAEFYHGNVEFTQQLLSLLESSNNAVSVLMTSSRHADTDIPYGITKRAAEKMIAAYGARNNIKVYIYRLTNVFGKWSQPNYHSVIATFCYNIACGLPIIIRDSETVMNLCYIDDVVNEFINLIVDQVSPGDDGFYHVNKVFTVTLRQIADKLYAFRDNRETLKMPSLRDDFDKYLYSTYLSFLPEDKFAYLLDMKADIRGYFSEIIKMAGFGQISVSMTKPGVTRGNHWHRTKVEKYLVVNGEAIIKFRKVGNEARFEYRVSGEKLQLVDIPPGYAHSITNIGRDDLITLFWSNEEFDPKQSDTYFFEV